MTTHKEQEPVAWITDRDTMYFDKEDARRDCDGFIFPLYTTPPQRKPLTFEQRMRICNECGDSVTLAILLTEDAHGIKE